MSKSEKGVAIPDEILMSKIYQIRGQKVMLDRELAVLYQVETKRLKEAVRRNTDRFPDDFMFELSKEEFSNWRSQFATSNSDKMGLRVPPFAAVFLSCLSAVAEWPAQSKSPIFVPSTGRANQ